MLKSFLRAAAAALGLWAGLANAQSHLDLLMAGDYPGARAALARLVGTGPDARLHFASSKP